MTVYVVTADDETATAYAAGKGETGPVVRITDPARITDAGRLLFADDWRTALGDDEDPTTEPVQAPAFLAALYELPLVRDGELHVEVRI